MEPVLLLFFIALAAAGICWNFSRSQTIIEEWAASQGYEIVHSEYRWFFRGPFSWFTSDGQTVYFVTVRDCNGIERSGFLRCGGYFFGLFSNKAEVRWDD